MNKTFTLLLVAVGLLIVAGLLFTASPNPYPASETAQQPTAVDGVVDSIVNDETSTEPPPEETDPSLTEDDADALSRPVSSDQSLSEGADMFVEGLSEDETSTEPPPEETDPSLTQGNGEEDVGRTAQ